MVVPLLGSAAPIAAIRRSPDGGRTGPAPRSAGDHGRSAAEDGGRRLFCFAMQSREIEGLANLTRGIPAAENSRRTPLWARTACCPIALWKARGRSPFREGRIPGTNAKDRSENELGVIIQTPTRPSSSGTGAHLPRQAGGARPREYIRRQGGGGLH